MLLMVKQVDTRSIFRRNALSICSDWRGHTHRRGGGQTPGAKLDSRTHTHHRRSCYVDRGTRLSSPPLAGSARMSLDYFLPLFLPK